ncbi:Carns1, partial [Symbiodinium sp. CCMP2592]
ASRRGLPRERAAAGQSLHESGSTLSPHLGAKAAKAPLPESPRGASRKPAASDSSPLLLDDMGDDPVDDNKSAQEVASTSRRLFESPQCERRAYGENAKHQIHEAAGIHHGSAERLWRSSSDHPPSPSETVASSAWSLRSRRYRSGNPLSSQHLETLQSFAEQQQLQERRDYNARNFRKALAGVGVVVPVASAKALTEASGPILATPQRRRSPRVTTTPEKDSWDDRTSCARTFDGLPLRTIRQVAK